MLLRILKVAITARDSVTRDCTLMHNSIIRERIGTRRHTAASRVSKRGGVR